MLNLVTTFGSRANAASSSYPAGSYKDDTSATVKDGTPVAASTGNDDRGFRDALLLEAGYTANNIVDTALSSQAKDAAKEVLSRPALYHSCLEVGLNLVSGSFKDGGTVTTTTDVLWDKENRKIYSWGGTLPKVVPAGSTPATAGGVGVGAWSDKTDLTLRSDLAATTGAGLVGTTDGITVQAKLNAIAADIANTSDVNSALALKANTSDVNSALALKANTSDVNSALALKANTSDVNSALALKANTSDVNAALALKANTSDVNAALALKANTSDLATKADTGTVIGLGQVWQNLTSSQILTSSRAYGTTYYNTTGKPIFVVISASSAASATNTSTVKGYVDGMLIATNATAEVGGNGWRDSAKSFSFIVPPGSSYSATGTNTTTLVSWLELR